jgi:hypothetical protein
MTNEGTGGLWLREEKQLKLTLLEVGWLWVILDGLDRERGEDWPTAKPGPDGQPIQMTMPRRIADKLSEIMGEQ